MKLLKSVTYITPAENPAPAIKVGGLYLLERSIILFALEGVKTFHLDLTTSEKSFFERKIKRRIMKRFPDLTFVMQVPENVPSIEVPANIFFQQHILKQEDTFRKTKTGNLESILSETVFTVSTPENIKKAEKLLTSKIISDTPGFIARELNKRMSIPLSVLVCKTRIHPNIITLFNFVIGIFSAFFLFRSADTSAGWLQNYLYMALGGTLFQTASVFDGVDGEVAKITLRTSKLGGWLDTAVDSISLILILGSASYVHYRHFGGTVSSATIITLAASLLLIHTFLVYYTKNYSEIEKLTAFDIDVLQKAPQDDLLIKSSNILKYLIKKELFSIKIFILCITGFSFLILPVAAFITVTTSILLVIIYFKYRYLVKKKEEKKI